MVDVRRPVSNPELVAALDKLRNDNTRENEEKVLELIQAAHFLIPAVLDAKLEPGGKTVLKKDSTIKLSLIETVDGKSFFPAFTDWDELRKWRAEETQQTFIFTYLDFAALLNQEGCPAGGLVINPMGANLVLTRQSINSLGSPNGGSHVTREVIKKETSVIIGDPADYPDELVDALKLFFRKQKMVDACFLRLMIKENQKSFLLIVDSSQAPETLFQKIGDIAAPYLKGMPLDMIKKDSDFGASATKDTKPFYTKKRFGFF